MSERLNESHHAKCSQQLTTAAIMQAQTHLPIPEERGLDALGAVVHRCIHPSSLRCLEYSLPTCRFQKQVDILTHRTTVHDPTAPSFPPRPKPLGAGWMYSGAQSVTRSSRLEAS